MELLWTTLASTHGRSTLYACMRWRLLEQAFQLQPVLSWIRNTRIICLIRVSQVLLMLGVHFITRPPTNGFRFLHWLQSIFSCYDRLWNSIIAQGRGDHDGWVTKFRIQYTLDGIEWYEYEDGKVFGDVPVRNGKKRFNLTPFYATAIRLNVTEWHVNICLRFGATFINQWSNTLQLSLFLHRLSQKRNIKLYIISI